MRRRDFITLVGGTAAWPLAARAQQPKVWRIGVLAPLPPTPATLSAFRDGMRGRGYVEGQNLSIDVRWPQGSFDQDPSVVAELVNSNVDAIVAWATPATLQHEIQNGLGARRLRPRRRAAEQGDELAPPHSITSSARC